MNIGELGNLEVKLSKLAKRVRLEVKGESKVILVVPASANIQRALEFLKNRTAWIKKAQDYFKNNHQDRSLRKSSRKDFLKHKSLALKLAREAVLLASRHYGFKFGKISVKNQKTRWGSCSKKGNLNFNYRIVYLPDDLLFYLAVHEVCHLKEMNHSQKFWQLVSETVPDYKIKRRKLKNFTKNSDEL